MVLSVSIYMKSDKGNATKVSMGFDHVLYLSVHLSLNMKMLERIQRVTPKYVGIKFSMAVK